MVRLLACLFVLQLSGALHAAVDEIAGHQSTSDDCDEERGGTCCPPGCVGCHHSHSNLLSASVPRRASASPSHAPNIVMRDHLAWPSPAPRLLFRPPRALFA